MVFLLACPFLRLFLSDFDHWLSTNMLKQQKHNMMCWTYAVFDFFLSSHLASSHSHIFMYLIFLRFRLDGSWEWKEKCVNKSAMERNLIKSCLSHHSCRVHHHYYLLMQFFIALFLQFSFSCHLKQLLWTCSYFFFSFLAIIPIIISFIAYHCCYHFHDSHFYQEMIVFILLFVCESDMIKK